VNIEPSAGYEIFYEPNADDDLDCVPTADFQAIDLRICALHLEPRPSGVSHLTGNVYRIRCGNWRIIYLIDDTRRCVVIGRVKRRNERTYDV
jgi:mRNA interferase RelE/StbE